MIIGLTGNIGSGKTLISKIFENLGITVYNADEQAKKLYSQVEIQEEIREKLNLEILSKDGGIDFKKIAENVFGDKKKLEILNSIIHPRIMQEIALWAAQHSKGTYCIVESAIIFEQNLESYFNRVIVVSAPNNLRLRRVIKRDNSDEYVVNKRIMHQMEERVKVEKASFVIINDETQALMPQVLKIHLFLQKIINS
jgi:dephospho-CoA kinase